MPKFLEVTDTHAAKEALNADFYVNVKDFGAVGDGVANDTEAIHAARDAAGVGGRLLFPNGTYKVGVLTANKSGQTWHLDGATLQYAGAANSDLLTVTAADVSIVGGTLNMSSVTRNPTAWQGKAIVVQADRTTIRNCSIVNSPTHGVYAVNVNDLTVTGCIIKDAGFYGVMAQATTNNVTMSGYLIADNRISGSEPSQELAGIYLRTENDTQSFSRVRISNNAITLPFGPNQYFSGSAAHAGILIWRGNDCVVDGNNIIGGWEAIGCPYSTRLTISSNTISSFFGIGIEIAERQKNVAITGNVIDANGYGENDVSGIQISGNGAEAPIDNVTISGNVITGFTKSAATARAIFLGSYGAINRMTIVGNTILAGGGSGQFNGITTNHTTTNLTICGNTIDCGSRSPSRGVLLQGNVHTGMTVSGNNFANCASGAFGAYVFGTGNFTDIRFVGNVTRNCGAVVEGDYSSAATRFVVDSEPNLTKINDSNGKTAVELTATPSALNYVKVFNAAGSDPVQIYASSAITPNVPLMLGGQGSNSYTGIVGAGGNIIQMWPVANQVSYWRMYSAAAGQDLELNATGTNTSMNFTTYGTGVVKANGVQLATISGTLTTPTIGTTLTLSDGANVVANTTTGSKIGTGTTQKLGFWNAAPIAQPTTAVSAAAFTANAGTPVNDGSTFDGYSIGQIVKALRNSGLLA